MNEGDLIGVLRDLGLTQYEAITYYTLLKYGGLRATQIVRRSDQRVPRGRVYDVLHSLQKKRFIKIERQEEAGTTVQVFYPIAPSFALAETIAEREHFMRTLQSRILPIFESMYETGTRSTKMERLDLAWIVRGDATFNTIFDYFDTATSRIRLLTQSRQAVRGMEMGITHNLLAATKRGVQVQHISNLDEPFFRSALAPYVATIKEMIEQDGYRVKFNHHIHTSLFLIDDRISIHWLFDPDDETVLAPILIDDPPFTQYLGNWFESFWHSSENRSGETVFNQLFGQEAGTGPAGSGTSDAATVHRTNP